MKIGIVVPSESSGHKVRGIGFYTSNLIKHLKKLPQAKNLEVLELSNPMDAPEYLDLIHFPYFELFIHSLPIIRHIPTIVTVHDVIPLEYPNIYNLGLRGQVNLKLQKIALNTVQSIITDSYVSVQAIHHYLNIPHSKIHLAYLAVDDNFKIVSDKNKLSFVRSKYHLPAKFILFVGDINWNKNVPRLISACEHLKIPLVWVGKKALEIEKLDLNHPELKHLKDLDLKSEFLLRLGFVPDEDMPSIYSLATCYCQPSFAEGFGLPLLEAMACGTPVVCSNSHSLPEIAQKAALYFNPEKEEELKTCLANLISNKSIQSEFSKKGIVQASKFSWEKTALSTYNCYLNVLSK